jgi:hypothetical protein
MKNFRQYLTETSLGRVWQHVNNPKIACAIITAFRGDKTYAANMQNNKKLASEVRSNKFGYFFVDGSFIENKGKEDEKRVREDSIFIVGNENDDSKLKTLIIKQGKKYNQDGVIFKPSNSTSAILIDLKNNKEIDIGKWHPNRISDYMTKLFHKRGSFVFESAIAWESKNWLGRWIEDVENKK